MVQPVVEQMETKLIVATGKIPVRIVYGGTSRCNLLINK